MTNEERIYWDNKIDGLHERINNIHTSPCKALQEVTTQVQVVEQKVEYSKWSALALIGSILIGGATIGAFIWSLFGKGR